MARMSHFIPAVAMTDPKNAGPFAQETLTLDPFEVPRAFEEPELELQIDTAQGLWAVVFAGGIGTRFWPMSHRKPMTTW